MPCCVPCSCLPTCRALDICCPNFNNSVLDAGKHPTEKSRLQSQDAGNTHEELLHTDDIIIRPNESQTETNTNREDARAIDGRLICVRPQILRDQNEYLDSQAYKMIANCPAEDFNATIDQQCKNGFADVDFNNIVPVTSSESNITYLNKHCLTCNENTSLESELQYWQPIITIETWQYTHKFYSDPQDIVSYLLKYQTFNGMKPGNIHFLAPNTDILQPCQHYDVTSCNWTKLWDVYNKTTEHLCLSGYTMPIIRRIEKRTVLFKNVACLYCNQPNESFGRLMIWAWSKCSKRRTAIGEPIPRFNMTLNLPDLKSSVKKENKSIPISNQYINAKTVLALMKTAKVCPDGSIAFLGLCRKVMCPKDHYNEDGFSVPLYNTLSGINLHVKFEITPSRRIASADRLYFANSLISLVNSTLNQTTSLHHIHLSVWYLPRSDAIPDEFYLLNMFLTGRGVVSIFDRSINDIQRFYNALKTSSKLRHIRIGHDITLQYKFGHRVEFEHYKAVSFVLGGVKLKHLLTVGRSIRTTGPGMTISESNWCYRTAIWRNETEFVAKNVLIIKEADIQLSGDQFERNGLEFYVCLEFLHIGEGMSTEPPIVTTGPDDDDTPWYNDQTIVIAIVIVGMGLLVFVFCKIKARKFNQDLRHFQGADNTDDANNRESFELDVQGSENQDNRESVELEHSETPM